MKIPKKITPCPIAEAIFEIRFDSDLPGDAVFGIIYNEFKSEFKNLTKLPILQLPDPIRTKDPNLIYSPHYKLQNKNFILQVGPKVLSLVNIKEYCGWDLFSKKIEKTFTKISKTGVIKTPTRIGLRYVNFFENLDIYEKSNLKLLLNSEPFNASHIDLTANVPTKYCISRVKMANKAIIGIEGKKLDGSIIDIDVEYKKAFENFFEHSREIAEIAHEDEKIIFFGLLKDKFLKSLNPEY
jgi:uncharacterized protein (TIGR04255 family)